MPTTQYVIAMTKLFHVPADYLLGTDSDMTISLRGYSEKEISLILSMLQYFDGER